jgi:hypothetical protein
MLDSLPTYPVTGAYVVQLHREARPERGLWIGRIEHVASGLSHEFEDSASLLAWLLAQAGNTATE